LQKINKDSSSIEDLSKSVGLDKTEELLASKSNASYDELKLKEIIRLNENLTHKISQAVKDKDTESATLVNLMKVHNEMLNNIKLYSTYKTINSEMKATVQSQSDQLRAAHNNEEELKSQNERLTKMVEEKKNMEAEREKVSQKLLSMVRLGEKFVDVKLLINQLEEDLRQMGVKARSFRNKVKLAMMQ
jgi:hypothetical protein